MFGPTVSRLVLALLAALALLLTHVPPGAQASGPAQPSASYARLDVSGGLVPTFDGSLMATATLGKETRTQSLTAQAGKPLEAISLVLPATEGPWTFTLEAEKGSGPLLFLRGLLERTDKGHRGTLLEWRRDQTRLNIEAAATTVSWTVGASSGTIGAVAQTRNPCTNCTLTLALDVDGNGEFGSGERFNYDVSGTQVERTTPHFATIPPTARYEVLLSQGARRLAFSAGLYNFIEGAAFSDVEQGSDDTVVVDFAVVFDLSPRASVIRFDPRVVAGWDGQVGAAPPRIRRELRISSSTPGVPSATPTPPKGTSPPARESRPASSQPPAPRLAISLDGNFVWPAAIGAGVMLGLLLLVMALRRAF
jgi:hypothetical protein